MNSKYTIVQRHFKEFPGESALQTGKPEVIRSYHAFCRLMHTKGKEGDKLGQATKHRWNCARS